MVEVYRQHTFGQFGEFQDELHASVTYDALNKCKSSAIDLDLLNVKQERVGLITINFEAFLKYKGFSQKVGADIPTEKPHRSPSPVNRSNSIREIMMQNLLSNKMMTISSVVCHHAFHDP